MRISEYHRIPAHVTFSNGVIRVFLERGHYITKFYSGESYIGEIELRDLTWGAFENQNELKDWRIEFCNTETKKIESIHYHLVHGSNVLYIPLPKTTNGEMIKNLIEDIRKANKIGASTWVFFEGCYRFREELIQEGARFLRIGENQEEEFPFIIEKKY